MPPATVKPVTLRVLVAEDQALLREGLVRLLADLGFDVVAQAADADELLRAVHEHRPDVVVVDVQMPPNLTDDGLRAALRIRQELPGTGILVLSQFLEEHYALDLIGEDASGVGYLLKDRVADAATLADAIRRVADGGSALDPEVVGRMVSRKRRDTQLDALTTRERQVLALMAEGKSNPGIGEALGVTSAAVEKHVTGIFQKLGVGHEHTEHRRVMAVLARLRAG
ncbi:MAG: two component transcriptional regulator, LuxR family [Solirubrobacterales bacterium]|nr:two component transcriptional regulator, LuxR family [Solirubrobacterales bacterium]